MATHPGILGLGSQISSSRSPASTDETRHPCWAKAEEEVDGQKTIYEFERSRLAVMTTDDCADFQGIWAVTRAALCVSEKVRDARQRRDQADHA